MTKCEALQVEIDSLSSEILLHLNDGDWDQLSVLITRRHVLLKELMTMQADPSVMAYVKALKEKDQVTIQALFTERSNIEKSLSNINKIKQYQ